MAVIITLVVVLTALQPPAAGIEYFTVYVAGVLSDGLISPVVTFILSPDGATLNVPPVYPPVPVSVTVCDVVTDLQNGDPE